MGVISAAVREYPGQMEEEQMCPVCSSFQILIVMMLESMAWASLRFSMDSLETLTQEEFLAFFYILDVVCSLLSSFADCILVPSTEENVSEKCAINISILPSSMEENNCQIMLINLLRIFIHVMQNNLAPLFLDSIFNHTNISRNITVEDISVIGEMAYYLFVLLYHTFIEDGEVDHED